MKRININDPRAVEESVQILKAGGVIVYPTDTLYGFGVDAKNDRAINKLNEIKGRKGPISVLAPNTDTALGWMEISVEQGDLVPFYLGGPKTLIVPVKTNLVSPLILGDNQTLGIRVPNHPFCQKISAMFPNPITTTSVNRTNEKPLNDPGLISLEFAQEIDLIIDGGTLPPSVGSTIYQLINNNIKIIRE